MGIYIGYPTPETAPIPQPRPSFGGLGGLGGSPAQQQPSFLQSDGFGNVLSALGMSLMGSPRNAPLSGFGQTFATLQQNSQARRGAEEERAAIEQVLVQSGIELQEARALSANPQAAKLRLDQMQAQQADHAQQAETSRTVDWLVRSRGLSPEEAMMVAGNREALNDYLSPQRSGLMNAGDGMIYDPNTGTWLTAPNRAGRPPQIETFYDEETGQPYNAQWNAETGSWERVGGVKAPSGMQVTTNPDGTVSVTQGPISGGNKLTEQQSKDSVYATRAAGALPIIDRLGDALTSLGETVGGQAPVVGNFLKSPEFQQAEQAGREFLQAILRKDTGAAITTQEVNEYGTVYLPRPGDSAEVLAQKKASRQRALKALALGLPADIILRLEKAGVDFNAGSGLPGAPDSKSTVIDGYIIEQVD